MEDRKISSPQKTRRNTKDKDIKTIKEFYREEHEEYEEREKQINRLQLELFPLRVLALFAVNVLIYFPEILDKKTSNNNNLVKIRSRIIALLFTQMLKFLESIYRYIPTLLPSILYTQVTTPSLSKFARYSESPRVLVHSVLGSTSCDAGACNERWY